MGSDSLNVVYTLTEQGILQIGDIFKNCFRWIGWMLIKGLSILVNGIEECMNNIYTLNGFFNSPEITSLINKYKPIIWTILAISIAILGFKIIFNKQQNRGELPANILFSILVVVLLPTFMIKLNDITRVAVSSVGNTSITITDTLVKEGLYDIYHLDSIGFDLNGEKNRLGSHLYNIDINEPLDSKELSTKEDFDKKVVYDEEGNRSLEKLDKGWFKLDEEYYRYSINFIPIIISLGAMAIAFICIILKVTRLMIDLAFNKFFATLLAFADIADGKKLKEIIKHIISIFIVIFFTAVLTNMYMLYNTWLSRSLIENGLGRDSILKLMAIVGGAIAITDGPNIVERILGIDVGLKSSWGIVMAGYGASRAITSGVLNGGKALGSLANGINKASNGLAMGAAGATGAVKGLTAKENKEEGKNSSEMSKEAKSLENINKASETKNNSTLQEDMKKDKNNSEILGVNPNETLQTDKSSDINGDKNIANNSKLQNQNNGQTLQEEMKAKKQEPGNRGAISDKLKEVEALKNNSNKEFDKGNTNGIKQHDLKANNETNNIPGNVSKIDSRDIPEGSKIKSDMKSTPEQMNGGVANKQRKLSGKMEDRTIGQYIKDKGYESKIVNNVSRAYNIGYNTTSKWNVKRKNNRIGSDK